MIGGKAAALATAAAAPDPAVNPGSNPGVEAERQKVAPLVRRLEEGALARHRKRPWLAWSVGLGILLPTLVASLYYVAFAADRFIAEARFAVRSNDAEAADALGLITGMPSSTVVSDSYIVADFIMSAGMVEALEKQLPLRAIYASERGDFLTRLDPEASREELVEYWNDQIDVYYDSTKNTIALEVQAFTPADAERVAAAIVEIARGLVNELPAQFRRDAVQFAAGELARGELRVRAAREALLAFRTTHNDFDPTQTAAANLEIAGRLEGEVAKLNAQLASVAGYLSDAAPSVQRLKANIRALEDEVGRIQGHVSSGAPAADGGTAQRPPATGRDAPLASLVADYQSLQLDQEFAEKAYTAAMASLERAKTEADRTQSYLAIYMQPDQAEEATYPTRALNILVVFILASVLWAVAAFATLTVKDHLA